MAENSSEIERLRRVYKTYYARVAHRWSKENPGNIAIRQEHLSTLVAGMESLQRRSLNSLRILDVGCGDGALLEFFAGNGIQPEYLYGIDLIAERVATASAALPRAHIELGNGERLAFEDAFFDAVTLFTVFSSILSVPMRINLAREVLRVTRPGGVVAIYDLRVPSPRNRNVRPLTRNAVKRLFPECNVWVRSLTLLPPLARRLGAGTHILYPMLARIPFLRTHNLLFVTRKAK